MSSSSSSDDDYNYASLKKKKQQIFKKKKEFVKSPVKKRSQKEIVDEDFAEIILSDLDETEESLESLMKNAKKAAKKSLTPEPEDLLEPSPPKKGRKKKKQSESQTNAASQNVIDPIGDSQTQSVLAEIEALERDVQIQDRRRRIALEKEIVEVEPIEQTKPYVRCVLQVKFSTDFVKFFNIDMDEQFAEKVFLKYSLEAGFTDPESFKVLWEHDNTVEILKFYETPKQRNMSSNQTVLLFFMPNEGTERETRKDGDIKLKFNNKKEKKPLEKFVNKDMTFEEISKMLMKEFGLNKRNNFRLIFDCERLEDDATPDSMGMEDLDIVDVLYD